MLLSLRWLRPLRALALIRRLGEPPRAPGRGLCIAIKAWRADAHWIGFAMANIPARTRAHARSTISSAHPREPVLLLINSVHG